MIKPALRLWYLILCFEFATLTGSCRPYRPALSLAGLAARLRQLLAPPETSRGMFIGTVKLLIRRLAAWERHLCIEYSGDVEYR